MKKLFSRESLKIIAMITMFIDHLGFVGLAGEYQVVFRIIGRIAFPIFAFQLAEGFLHTKNRAKYILRVFIFAIISEIPYNMATLGRGISNPYAQNVLFTFTLSLLCMVCLEKLCKYDKIDKGRFILDIIISIGILFVFHRLGAYAFVDYGGPGVILAPILYLIRKHVVLNKALTSVLVTLSIVFVNYMLGSGLIIFVGNLMIGTQSFAALSAVFIVGYILTGGKSILHGKSGLALKITGYAFYPVHLFILAIIAN